jgi:hypothetical protein
MVLGGGVQRCGGLRWWGGVPAGLGGWIGPILQLVGEGGTVDRHHNGEPWEAPMAAQILSQKRGSPVFDVERMGVAVYRALWHVGMG